MKLVGFDRTNAAHVYLCYPIDKMNLVMDFRKIVCRKKMMKKMVESIFNINSAQNWWQEAITVDRWPAIFSHVSFLSNGTVDHVDRFDDTIRVLDKIKWKHTHTTRRKHWKLLILGVETDGLGRLFAWCCFKQNYSEKCLSNCSIYTSMWSDLNVCNGCCAFWPIRKTV